MKSKTYLINLFLIAFLLLNSCISTRKLQYFEGNTNNRVITPAEKDEMLIKPNDELFIKVSSFDDIDYNYFNSQAEMGRMSFANDVSVALVTYTVDDSGHIKFPLLGDVYVKGLTTDAIGELLKKELSSFFNQPVVTVKIANKRITILGEVRVPGSYVFTKNRITIFEALGFAGDININGNKSKVFLIREKDNKIYKERINLLKEDVFTSDYYYVESHDVIYVAPKRSASWNLQSTPVYVFLTAITTTFVALDYFK